MYVTVKVPLNKEWTLLEDRIIYGKKEIMLSDVVCVKSFSKPTFFASGLIDVTYEKNKSLWLSFDKKTLEVAEAAKKYIEENCGGEKETENTKRIKNEISKLPSKDLWGNRVELESLDKVLDNDESIKAIITGLTDKNNWLILCTNKRIKLLNKSTFSTLKDMDIYLDKIINIDVEEGFMFGSISIETDEGVRKIENINMDSISFFVDTVNIQIYKYKEFKAKLMEVNEHNISIADELLKFKNLLDMGVLTVEEFNKLKEELLNK